MPFQKAVKFGARLRMALVGPSGAGKTYSALSIASGLGERIAFVDTECGSARKYADDFNFDVLELNSFSVENYIRAINDAVAGGYDVLIIDSLSHAWMGKDGILEFVDERTAASRAKNAYTSGWRDATPLHNRLVDTILQANLHVICAMRSKVEYVLQDDGRGKKVPVKIGMQPVQRESIEYEFDVVADLDVEHNLIIGKTRCVALDRRVFPLPGENVAAVLREWLSGAPAPVPPKMSTPTSSPALTAAPVSAPKPEPPVSAAPAPVPPVDQALSDARDRVYSRLRVMVSENQNGYDEVLNVLADVKAALRVDKVSICEDVELLNNFYEWLGERRHSETPWVRTPYVVLIQPQVQKLLDKIDAEVTTGRVIEPESVKETLLKSAMNMAELNDEGGLKALLKQIKTFAPVPKAVSPDIELVRAKIHSRFKIMVSYEIDRFETSSRLTESVKEHLGVDRLDKCTDAARMLAYAEHLTRKIEDFGNPAAFAELDRIVREEAA